MGQRKPLGTREQANKGCKPLKPSREPPDLRLSVAQMLWGSGMLGWGVWFPFWEQERSPRSPFPGLSATWFQKGRAVKVAGDSLQTKTQRGLETIRLKRLSIPPDQLLWGKPEKCCHQRASQKSRPTCSGSIALLGSGDQNRDRTGKIILTLGWQWSSPRTLTGSSD